MECANEILACGDVDRGLAADRRLDHREQRRWHVRDAHTAQVRRGREPGSISDRTAAERDDAAVTSDASLRERLPQRADRGQ